MRISATNTIALLCLLPAIAAPATTGCSSSVVKTGDATTTPEPSSAPTAPTRPSNEKLVNAFDYYVNSDDRAGYYFVTPNGSWRCVIVPHNWVGCQGASGAARIGIAGAPATVTDDTGDKTGQPVAPNAIVASTLRDPGFAFIPADQFKPASGTAKTLPYNKVLAAAGFHCNVQELVGVSCLSEEADNGFTFTSDKFSWQYTDVP